MAAPVRYCLLQIVHSLAQQPSQPLRSETLSWLLLPAEAPMVYSTVSNEHIVIFVFSDGQYKPVQARHAYGENGPWPRDSNDGSASDRTLMHG